MKKWLVTESPLFDIIIMVGTNFVEEKLHRTRLFLDDDHNTDANLENDTIFSPQGCFTTRSLGSAGWDCQDINNVFSLDFPDNLLSVLQEKGRCGRRKNANGTEDFYTVFANLTSIEYMLKRILSTSHYDKIKKKNIDSYDIFQNMKSIKDNQLKQLNDFHEILYFFILPNKCQHLILEDKLGNPNSHDNNVIGINCNDKCQFCIDKGINELFPRIVIQGTRRILCSIFFGENVLINPLLSTTFVDAIRNYPCSQKLLFNSSARLKPERYIISQVVMMLITSRLVGYKLTQTVHKNSKDNNHILGCFLNTENGIPLILNDNNWGRLPLKETNLN